MSMTTAVISPPDWGSQHVSQHVSTIELLPPRRMMAQA